MNKGALIGLALLGVGLVVLGGTSSSQPKAVVPPPPETKPRREPATNPPPLTLNPKGRYMTAFERFVMKNYFPEAVLNSAKLWFGRPASSFKQETDSETGVTTDSVTTKDGIYFRFENHEISSPHELALLAHELVHWQGFFEGHPGTGSDNEVRAYQIQIAVKQDLDGILEGLKEQWTGARYA